MSKGKKLSIFIIVIFLIAFIFLFVFRVQKVQVIGNQFVKDEVIKEWVMDDVFMNNSIIAVLKNQEKTDSPIATNSVQVSFSMPWKLKAVVEEKKIVGYIKQNKKKIYFDQEGCVLTITTETFDDIYQVKGLGKQSAKEGEILKAKSEDVFSNIREAIQVVEEQNLTPGMIEVDGKNILLIFGGIKVNLGNENIEERVYQIPEILRMLGNETGILHVEKYSPEIKTIWFEDLKNEKISAKSID